MSVQYVRFRSEALSRSGEFYILLPPKEPPFFMPDNPYYQRPVKTLILLHGYSGDCTDWLYSAPVSDYSLRYNLAIVMPSGGVSFYLDKKATGHRYCTFVGEDLIAYLRETFGLAMNREDTMIGGLSMGGFGALHTGLMYPETFSGIIALSSALIVEQLKEMSPNMKDPVMANYEYYVDTFGDLKKAERSTHNPKVLYRRNVREGRENPRIYMACGTEDFLLAPNRKMRDFLKRQKADYYYTEGPGVHDWAFWIPHAQEGIEYLLNHQ